MAVHILFQHNVLQADKSLAQRMRLSLVPFLSLNVGTLDILDEYLDLVELPPTESGNYDKEF